MVKITKENKAIRYIIIGLAVILAFLGVVNPDLRSAVFIDLVFLGISFAIYSTAEYQDDLVGINKKNVLESVGWGIFCTFAFFLITLIVPGMSIGYPQLAGDISGSLKWFMIVIVSPIVESIFFLGGVYAFVRNFQHKHQSRFLPIFISSVLFALFHVGAYIIGWYTYPDFTSGLSAIIANISAFIVAFLFNMIAGYIMTSKKVNSQIFAFIFHFGLNLVSASLSIITFAISLVLFH